MASQVMTSSNSSDESKRAKRSALACLARREMSGAELLVKLKKRFSDRIAETIVSECVAKGYVDDERFADMVVRSEKAKGHGPRRVALALQKKGLGSLDFDYPEEEERKILSHTLNAYRAKRGSQTSGGTLKERARLFRQMARRGFHHHLIQELLAAHTGGCSV